MSYGKMAVDWERRINFDQMRKDRIEKARASMKRKGLEAMLVLSGDNARYVAQNPGEWHSAPTGMRYILLRAEGTPVLWEFGMWYPYVKENCPWLDVRQAISLVGGGNAPPADFFPQKAYDRQLEKFAKQIEAAMREYGLIKETLGIDAYVEPMMKSLSKFGIEVSLKGRSALMEARTLKTKDEVECLRTGASMVESGWCELKNSVRPGISEMELKGVYMGEVYRLGADVVLNCDVVSGPRTWNNVVTTSDRMVRPGDLLVLLGCNLSYMGYRTCYYRTFSCGEPTQAQKDTYARTRDYLYDAIKTIKPGATTKDIVEKWPKAEEFDYLNEDAALMMQWAHGIGLSLAEPPSATRLWSLDFPERLEAGMTLGIETWLPTREKNGTYPRGQSVRIEEMVAVTDTGYDILTRWPIDELTICRF